MQIAYVSSAGDRRIRVFGVDAPRGKVALIEEVEVPGPDQQEPISLPLAISTDQRFLYAAIRTPPYPASTLAIDRKSGRLKHLGSAELPDGMAYIAPDRSNRILLSASYTGSKIAVNPIAANGTISPAAMQVFEAPRAHCIIPSTDNRFAYAALHGGDTVMHYALDVRRGILTACNPPGAPTKPGAGPRHLVLHPPTRRMYVLNERNGSVDTLAVDESTGALTPLASVSMLPAGYSETPTAADIHITRNGRFLYTSERTASFITTFVVSPDQLTPVDWLITEASPRGFQIDPDDRCLLVVGQFSGRMSVYAIDQQTGRLSKTDDCAVGPNPNWIEILNLSLASMTHRTSMYRGAGKSQP